MTIEDKPRLVEIHETCAKGAHVEAVRLMMEDQRFVNFINANKDKAPRQIRSTQDLRAMMFLYLMSWLYQRDYEAAATLCWGPEVFTCEPRSVKMVWNAIREKRLINLLGAASMSKTYGPSAWFLLDWVLDPEWTLVRVMSTKEDHVKKNLFADIQRLYLNSAFPMPGKSDTESIATENGKRSGQGIFMLVIPRGQDAGGTIKGSKIKPRAAHPLFGTSSRTRLLIDEAQEVQESAFDEIPNLYSSMEEDDVEHTKIVMAANPKDEFSRYGKNSVPAQGWDGIRTKDSAIDEWTSATGWHCVRLNAMKSENVTGGRTIYPRFFTLNGLRMKLRDVSGDVEHPLIWSEVYGMFPPKGMMSAIIQKHWVDRSRREWIFESETFPVAGDDVAFTGDLPTMSVGRVGRAVGWHDYDGKRFDLPEPRWVIQADGVGVLPRGDSQDLADEYMSRAKILGIKPARFAIDRTGVGQGTHDIIRRQWREKVDGIKGSTETVDIMGINYAEAATVHRISEEDTKAPKELYDGIRSELWYATAKFFEYDCIGIGRGVDDDTISELVGRRGGSPAGKGKLLTVESKDDFKKRNNNRSPDRADGFTMMVQCARLSVAELLPRAPATVIEQDRRPNAVNFFGQEEKHPGLKIGDPIDMGFNMSLEEKIDLQTD